jgi:membrane protein implicated in regulation of membrane protease activity
MTNSHRLFLLFAAFPVSAVIATSTLFLLGGSWEQRVLIASVVYALGELVSALVVSKIPPRMGPETIPGREAEVLSDFTMGQCGSYVGYVRLAGENWRARTAGAVSAAPGTGHTVRVKRVDGLTLLVSPLPIFE